MVWAGASLVLGIVLLIADLISENRKYRKNPEHYIATDRSEEGAGKITFTAYESGDVYLEFYTDAALYTTIDVSAVVK